MEGRSRSEKSGLRKSEQRDMHKHQRMRAAVIYQTIRGEGEEELRRPNASLWWSGLVAGIAISLSLYGSALVRMHLPDAVWAPLLESLGYTMGFYVVILGRLQLFTESTITPVLPLIANFSPTRLGRMLRLWGIVLIANFAGTCLVAALTVSLQVGGEDQLTAALEIARHALDKSAGELFCQAVVAGFLMAVLVWMLPSAHGSEFFIVVPITYLIGLGGFSHIVVDSAKGFLLLFSNDMPLANLLRDFSVILAGNIVGGTVIFALLAYGQVRREICEDSVKADENG